MPGLYIIEETMISEPSIFTGLSILSAFGLFILTFIFMGEAISSWFYEDSNFWWTLSFISAFCTLIVPFIFIAQVPTYPAYKAIITSEINQEQFYEKYEIIDKENDLYIIKEIDYK